MAPVGMPTELPSPPVVAESGDPFAVVRVIQLAARLPRGTTIPVRSLVERLNATHLDWLFEERAVTDALLQLQANWMADYRNTSGIVIEDGPDGPALTIEDSTRVDPWIVRQAHREVEACHEVLREFSLRDRPTGE